MRNGGEIACTRQEAARCQQLLDEQIARARNNNDDDDDDDDDAEDEYDDVAGRLKAYAAARKKALADKIRQATAWEKALGDKANE